MAVILALLEGLGLFAAVCATIFLWARPLVFDWLDAAAVLAQSLTLALCCIVAFYYNDLYDLRVVRSFGEFASRLLQAFGVAFILLAGFYTLFPDTRLVEGALISSLLLMVGLLLPLRAATYAVMRSGSFRERVLVLGTGALARRIVAEIEARPHFRYTVVGVADDGADGAEPGRYPLLGPLERLDKIIRETLPDRIVVAMVERRGRLPVRQLLETRARGVVVEDGVKVYERLTGKLAIESLAPSALVFAPGFSKSRLQTGLRRLASFVTAALGLVAGAPLMALIAAAIKLDSRGPVFFVQERAGLGGRPFGLVKFRTMHGLAGAEAGSVWHRDDEGRVTRVGRWLRKLRLDELPQFWNILKGDMDLIGPRPEMLCNVTAMAEEIPYYSLRHVVRPGITGWAQIKHGYSVSRDDVTEKMRYDLFYVAHTSLWLDLRIFVDTVKIVLFGRGAR